MINQNLKSINRRAQQFKKTSGNNTSQTASATSLSPNSENTTNNISLVNNESQLVKEKLDALNKAYELINVLGAERRKYLEEHRQLHKFIEEADEEWMWLQEKLQVVKTTDTGNDLSSTQILINKHEQLEDELRFRKQRIQDKIVKGEQLVASKIYQKPENEKIAFKSSTLVSAFESLQKATENRRSILEDSYSSQQYFADANEAESWMKDKIALVSLSSDCGKDEASSQALLQRHVRIQEEIKAYEPEVRRLDEITSVLAGKRRFSSFPVDVRQKLMKNKKSNMADLSEFENDDETEDEEIEDDQTQVANNDTTNDLSQNNSIGKNFNSQNLKNG